MLQNKNIQLNFHFKSFHFKILKNFILKILNKIKILNLNATNVVYLPIKRQRFVVLRSPHIDKKSREHFEIRSYHRLLILKKNSISEKDFYKIKLLINFIKNSSSGIQFKIEYLI